MRAKRYSREVHYEPFHDDFDERNPKDVMNDDVRPDGTYVKYADFAPIESLAESHGWQPDGPQSAVDWLREIMTTLDRVEGRIGLLRVQLAEQTKRAEVMQNALERLRDCDWTISLPDRMDAVRELAREALLEAERSRP